MEENRLVEKLSLQAESFQEGFEILARSADFSEMVKNFENILRGTFIIAGIHLFHKSNPDSEWKKISQRGKWNPDLISCIEKKTRFCIEYPADKKINAVAVVPLADSSVLGILLGKKLDKTEFSVFDKITLQIIIQVFDAAYNSYLSHKKVKELVFELHEKIFQLNNLIDTGIDLSKCSGQSELCELGLTRATALTNASSAFIEVSDKNKNSFNQYIFPPSADPEVIRTNKFSIESKFEYKNRTFRFILSEKETRKGATFFSDLDKILLDSISRQILASLENQDLHEQTIEIERMEKELSVAATIQKLIIPQTLPLIKGYDIAGVNIPSKEVGGDYYDCVSLPDDKCAVIIADVAGKGIGAALLVNTLSAALHTYLEFNITPGELALRLNSLIYTSTTPDKYITCFIALLDTRKNEMSVINAGHNPPLLLRKDKNIEKISAGGFSLGMFNFGVPSKGQNYTLNEGDSLFLYTDGITEAMNEKGEEYSEEKMTEILINRSHLPSKELIDFMVADVSYFSGLAKQSDDITAVYIKRV